MYGIALFAKKRLSLQDPIGVDMDLTAGWNGM